MNDSNRQWVLGSRPQGMVSEANFEMRSAPRPRPGEGEVTVRVRYIAFEPAMRGWLDDVKSYVPPVGLGEVMRASGVGQVVESKLEGFSEGDWVTGMFGWQEYALAGRKGGLLGGLSAVPAGVDPKLTLSVLGTTGLTAYFGMVEVGKPRDGDVVLVTGAAGATGSVAGQIARLRGASKVIGVAGGPEKCALLVDRFGFDLAIDYKSERVRRRLRETCPQGVNVFFDNVGGPLLDDGLINMARYGRIVICGGISAYNEESIPPGPKYYMQLVSRHLTMEGFLLHDYRDKMAEARAQLAEWVAGGKLVHMEDVRHGIENAPRTFLRLFKGENTGKQLLELDGD